MKLYNTNKKLYTANKKVYNANIAALICHPAVFSTM